MIRNEGIVALVLILALPAVCGATSLWKDQGSMFADHRALRAGDLVTVLISETSSATRTATTTTGRSSSMDDKIESWFSVSGLKDLISGRGGLKSHPTETPPEAKASMKHDFTGTGTTLRNDSLIAKVTCRILDVLPNGNLVIEGKQSVTVNTEEQTIVLRGVIRPEDVSAANTINSYNISDARIAYSGKGPLGDKQRRGFIQWLGDMVWPF